MRPKAGPPVVAYLSAGYPRVTDAFISREIARVEACGVRVESFAVRPPSADRITGPSQQRERDRTTYLLERRPGAHARALLRAAARPRHLMRALDLARRSRRAGLVGSLRQAAHVVEAASLAELMRAREVDHLHCHFADSACTVAMLASAMSGIPYSFTIHGPAEFFEPRESGLETKLATAEFCAAISMFARSQASIYCDPDRWDRIHVVHCGVDDLQPATPMNVGSVDAESPDAPLEVLFVGRLEPVKGVLVLFEAIAQLIERHVPLRVTVVGDGALRPDLEARAAALRLGSAVEFVGYRTQDEVRTHLAASHVLVLPSFAEGVPISLMEAMSQERTVVATEVGGVTELVHDGVDGLVVTPGDVDELAEALLTLAKDPERRREMGVAGRATVRADFDSATEARRLVALFGDAEGLRGTVRPAAIARSAP